MNKLLQMQVFVTVVEAGSFVAACDLLSMSAAAVSRHVAELESRLGVRLLHRSTRNLSLSDDGQLFFSQCKSILDAVDEAEAQAQSHTLEPGGTLRVVVPMSFGILHLAPLWGPFCAQFSRLRLDIALADHTSDLIEEGYDVAVRISDIAENSQNQLISRKLATTRLVACASPEYLARHGTPQYPEALAGHAIIGYAYSSFGDDRIFGQGGARRSVRVQPRIRANNGDTCRALALADAGIIWQPDFLVGEDIRQQRLVPLFLPDASPDMTIHAVYASRRQLAPKIRVMIDYLVACFQDADFLGGCNVPLRPPSVVFYK